MAEKDMNIEAEKEEKELEKDPAPEAEEAKGHRRHPWLHREGRQDRSPYTP